MEKAIADILPYAVAVALSPVPIAALLLMLLSNRARINSVAFTIGWIIGLAVLIFAVSFAINVADGATHTNLKHTVDIVLGLFLIFIAIKEWKKRAKPGESPQMPKWMSTVETFTPGKAFAIGLALSTINFKNTPLGIAVGASLSHYSSTDQIVGFISYLLIASFTILIPTIGFLLMGDKLKGRLQSLKNWLVANNATIMFVLFLILGVTILSKGLGA